MDYSYLSSAEPGPRVLDRLRRFAEDYEEGGRRFCDLPGEGRVATLLALAKVLQQIHDKFNLAKKLLDCTTTSPRNFSSLEGESYFPHYP